MAYTPPTAEAAYEWIRTNAAKNDFAQMVADELRSGTNDRSESAAPARTCTHKLEGFTHTIYVIC